MVKGLWVATSNGKKLSASAATKAELTAKAQQLLDQVLTPKYVQATPPEHDFNYVAALHGKWRGNSFYFSATYNCPSPNAIAPSFETKFARMAYVSNDRFNLSYMRYTEQWFEIASNWTMDQCLTAIAENDLFTP